MEKTNFYISCLKECHGKGDSSRILSSLKGIRKYLRNAKNINHLDRETYDILINLIKYPNKEIMDVTMSILANCCMKNGPREMFKELGGIPHLILILKTIDNNSILCRACRLLGNLANNYGLAKILHEFNAGPILLKVFEDSCHKSSDTHLMIFRAIEKLWAVKEYQYKMLTKDVSDILYNCLQCPDDQLVSQSVEALTLFSTVDSSKNKNHITVTKQLIASLVSLSKKEGMNDKIMVCLSHLICFQTNQVWKVLESSNLPETFIDYIHQVDNVNEVILHAFYKLCTEGAVRRKVKVSGLLPKLMKLCHGKNIQRILLIFYLFEFDITSIAVLAQDKEFITLLTRNISKAGAVPLLAVVSRLDPPVKELLSKENLDIIIKCKECHGVLKKISETKEFLSQLIISGRIWEISRENCLSEDQDGYAEVLLLHILRTGDRDEIENAALAVPFLIKPRHYTLYKILAHNNGITIILRLLKEKTLEERILATIVKLISIFQENFYNNNKHSRGFFDDGVVSTDVKIPCRNETSEDVIMEETATKGSDERCENNESVTFELDCGSLVTMNKNLLCKNSPVLDAMLNGHFIESNQQKVKLSFCSPEALKKLEELITNNTDISGISVEKHLELISLTDRFLMSSLNDFLSLSLPMNESSCVAVLQWCRDCGYTRNTNIIKKKAYEFVFSSSSYLLLAMQNDSLRSPLVNEVSNYLSNSFLDLL